MEHARFKEKQLFVEQKREVELAKFKLQQDQLQLVREGRLPGESLLIPEFSLDRSTLERDSAFDVVRNLRLLPKFN